jgi:DNA recombination protein RmuC
MLESIPLELVYVVLAGSLVVAIVTSLLLYQRIRQSQAQTIEAAQNSLQFENSQRELAESRITNASLTERLDGRDSRIAELEAEITRLNQVLDSERTALIQRREEVSRLKTSLEEQQLQSEEKLLLLKEAKESLHDGFKNLANDIFESKQKEFKTQSKEQLAGVLDPLHERIKAFEKRVEQTYNDEAKERFSLIKEVKSLQDLNSRIAQDAVNLTNALKGESKTQGAWGEVVLERVLESSGLEKGREYEIQVSLKSDDGQRLQPDAIVRLPEGKDVVVDSKVSLTAYEKYCSVDDDIGRKEALRAHIQSIRTHIKQLAVKDYQALEGIRTLDYVLMFVPIESAFSLAIQEDSALFTDALSRHIVIVTPSTLLATLRTIQNMWRIEQQNRNAEEIADRAGKLYDKFVNFVADLELIGTRLVSTQNAYDDAFNKLASGRGNLVKRAEDMKALGAKVSKSLPQNLVEMPQRDTPQTISSVDKQS